MSSNPSQKKNNLQKEKSEEDVWVTLEKVSSCKSRECGCSLCVGGGQNTPRLWRNNKEMFVALLEIRASSSILAVWKSMLQGGRDITAGKDLLVCELGKALSSSNCGLNI